MNAPAKLTTIKLTERIGRFDKSVGVPIGSLASFHDPHIAQSGHLQSLGSQAQDGEHPQKTYEDGVTQGRLLALAEVQSLEANIEQMVQALQQVGQEIEASHGRVIIAILTAVLPALAQNSLQTEIRDFLLKTSAQARYGHITIHAPVALRKTLITIIGSLGERPDTQPADSGFTLEIDNKTTTNKVRATWKGGGGEVDIDAAVKACLSLLENEYNGDKDERKNKQKQAR